MSKSSSDLLNLKKCEVIFKNESKKSLEYYKGSLLAPPCQVEEKTIVEPIVEAIGKSINYKYSNKNTKDNYEKGIEFWTNQTEN